MKGIDISSYQENVDFKAVKNSGVEVVILKATEGKTWQDPSFRKHYEDAKAVGLKVGVYHFLRGNAVEDEVNNFVSMIQGLNFECKLVIDAEVDLGGSTINSQHIKQFYDLMTAKGYSMALYTYTDFYINNLDDTIKGLPLWIANYGGRTGVNSYIGWQYGDNGNIPGINGNVDVNEFNEGIFANTYVAPQVQSTLNDIISQCAAFVGNRCKELQEKLIALGYDLGSYGADGKFGTVTYDALIKFQQDSQLCVDGKAGEQTFNTLNHLLSDKNNANINPLVLGFQKACNASEITDVNGDSLDEDGKRGTHTNEAIEEVFLLRGSQNELVRWVQEVLISLGFSCGDYGADADFGRSTLIAVQNFQASRGIKVDGEVGPCTINELLK